MRRISHLRSPIAMRPWDLWYTFRDLRYVFRDFGCVFRIGSDYSKKLSVSNNMHRGELNLKREMNKLCIRTIQTHMEYPPLSRLAL